MKETLNNLKKVYQYGKEYNKNLIFFTILSFAFVIINVIYPIFTAKQITYLSTGLFTLIVKIYLLSSVVIVYTVSGRLYIHCFI